MCKSRFIKIFAFASVLLFAGSINTSASMYSADINTEYDNSESETVKFLLVWDNEGGCVAFPLDERPRVTTDLKKSEITCVTSKQEITFSIKEVHKYTLDSDSHEDTAIDNLKEDEPGFVRKSGVLEFYGFGPKTQISVYTADGVLKCKYIADSDGCLYLDTQSWNNGIYIIKTGRTSYKIVKR